MNSSIEAVVTIFTGIIGVAILAVLVSQKSNTSSVIQSFGSAFTNALGVAESPVTGASFTPSGAYPSSGLGGLGSLGSLPNLTNI
jgi:PRD1 phage membrane DNA delivery